MQTFSPTFMEGVQNESTEPVQEQAAPVVQQNEGPTVADLMAFAFQDESPIGAPEVPAASDAPAIIEPAVIPAEAPAQTPEASIDEVEFLRSNFGLEDRAAIKSALEELQTLKQQAQTPSEYKYASDEAKRLAHAINTGDFKTVKAYAEAQELSIDGMTPEAQLKTYLKLQNPLFDQELIEDEFASLYSIDEQDEKYIDNPMQLRKDKLRLQQRQQNDLEKARDYFTQYKQKIQLPEIQTSQGTPIVDDSYEEYKASTAQSLERIETVVKPAIQSLKESDVNMNFSVNDANAHMNFPITLAPEKEDFEKAKNYALNFDAFIQDNFWENGKFRADKVQKMILRELNADKYAQTIARQAVNAERKRVIEKETPAPSTPREFVAPAEESEVEKLLKMAFSV